jgi:hypothetical protein
LRVSLKTSLGWLVSLLYLALPNCSFDGVGPPPENLQRGAIPRRAALMCDIPKLATDRCATDRDLQVGIRTAGAAVALAKNQKSTVGLDYSSDALCPDGRPMAVDFLCPFPEGCPVCVNCGVVGPSPDPYPNQDAVCAARCEDVFGNVLDDGSFQPDVTYDGTEETFVETYCRENARVSTNVPAQTCLVPFPSGSCSSEGAVLVDQGDPRRTPEPVDWRFLIGVSVAGAEENTLIRGAPGAPLVYDKGATSNQYVTHGDGYVEFTAVATDTGRALGLSSGIADTATPDLDPTLAGIGHAVRLSPGGEVFLSQDGVQLDGPNPPNGHWANHQAGDRIRVAWTDNFGLPRTATVTYSVIPAACTGTHCEGWVIPATTGTIQYPFRVDASLRHVGAALNDVRLVRIR